MKQHIILVIAERKRHHDEHNTPQKQRDNSRPLPEFPPPPS